MRTWKTKLQATHKWPCGEAEGKPEGLLQVRPNGDRDDLISKRIYKTNRRVGKIKGKEAKRKKKC